MPNRISPDRTRLKAVIFDLDGVIFDSLEANVAFYNHILVSLGLPAKAGEKREIIHREAMEGSLRALVGEGPDFHRAMDFWRTMDTLPFIAKLVLYPDVHRVLEELGRSLALAVATNRTTTTRPALRHFGLMEHFRAVVTPLEAGVAKPHPAVMQLVLESLGVEREEAVYVGDSTVDQDLCLESGVPLVAFRNPELRAWRHVDSFGEILSLFRP